MSINSWLYNRIISSTNINAIISGRCYPFASPSSQTSNVPLVVYTDISQKTNIFCRQPIISIRCVEKTLDKCEVLNEYLYYLFDNSTQKISEVSGDIRIEGTEIINNIPTLYDFNNKVWNGILDIKIYYEK